MCSLPAQVKKVFHPIITCAVTADLAAYALGVASGKGFEKTLGVCSLPRFSEFAYLMLINEELHGGLLFMAERNKWVSTVSSNFGVNCAGGYLTKSAGSPGAGDLLMGFLGSVILSFAFSMFRQREVG